MVGYERGNTQDMRLQSRKYAVRISSVNFKFKNGKLPEIPGTLLGVAVALTAFVLYLRTMAPTVLQRSMTDGLADSGLLQVRSYILGISNPTGYPTYILLGKLFTYLPFGDVGYRVNLSSAVYAAIAVFVLFALCRRLTGQIIPSAAAALLFGLSRAFWSQSIIAEVYTLNILFISLLIFVLLLWRDERKDRYLLLWAFLMGLSLTNHLTSGLLLPAGFIFVWLTERRKLLEWRLWLKGAGLFILALTPYAYIPIRASANPPLSGFHPTTLKNFFDFVTGRQFQEQMFVFGPSELPGRLEMYLQHLTHQFSPAFLVVAAFGLWYLVFKDRAFLAMLGVLYLGWLFYSLEYDIVDIWVYFIPTYLIACILVAPGISILFDAVDQLAQRLSAPQRRIALSALLVLVLLTPLAGMQSTYKAVNRSNDYVAQRRIDLIARNVEPGATVVTNGSSMWYMTLVEKKRTDIKVVSPFLQPEDWTSVDKHAWRKLAKRHMRHGPLYILFPDHTGRFFVHSFAKIGLKLVPQHGGAYYRVLKSSKLPQTTKQKTGHVRGQGRSS